MIMSEIITPINRVSGVLDHLTMLIAGVVGAPAIFDPDESYESAVKHYRTQLDDKFKHQEFKISESHPTIIAWKRSALRRNPTLDRRSKPTQYAWNLGRDGNYNGDTVKVVELLGEFDVYFTIYSRDVEFIEDFEIKYLSGYGLQNFRTIDAALLDNDGVADVKKLGVNSLNNWQIRILWSNDLEGPNFQKEDNSVISMSFQARLSGSFFSVIEGAVTPKVLLSIDHGVDVKKES